MRRILIIALLLLATGSATEAYSQGWLEKVGKKAVERAEDRAKKKVEDKVTQKVDEVVDRTFEGAEDAVKGNAENNDQTQQGSAGQAGQAGQVAGNEDALGVIAEKDDAVFDIIVRDFKADKILFESNVGYEKIKGMVQNTLGADKKPVFNLPIWTKKYGAQVTQQMLDALFNDAHGVNMSAAKTLVMKSDGKGFWITNSGSGGFYPIDNELFGNEGRSHNYHFSVEIHADFKYVKGAIFEFKGDDDVWVFFNNKLVIDLGGVNHATGQTVAMDNIASELGIKEGDIVNFDMFYMERHTTQSNLYIKTNFNFFDKTEMFLESVMNEGKFITYDITFDVGKSTIKPEAMNEINRIVKLMNENPTLKFSVEGHTDNTGNAASNQTLSEARSQAIVDKLVGMGISANRLSASGKGQNNPIADNSTDEGRAKNRRVEFVKR